jgi:hypothetical protein
MNRLAPKLCGFQRADFDKISVIYGEYHPKESRINFMYKETEIGAPGAQM